MQMRCDLCNEPATIHIQEVIDGQQKSLNLCPACAKEQKITPESLDSGEISEFLGKFEELVKSEPNESSNDWPELKCSNCGMDSARFRESGRLGCTDCFGTFAPILAQVLPTMHNGVQHLGRSPAEFTHSDEGGAALSRRRREIELKQQLEAAIAAEHYEQAASLRDELSAFEADQEQEVTA